MKKYFSLILLILVCIPKSILAKEEIDQINNSDSSLDLNCKGKVDHFILYADGTTVNFTKADEEISKIIYIKKYKNFKNDKIDGKWYLRLDNDTTHFTSAIFEKPDYISWEVKSFLQISKYSINGKYSESNIASKVENKDIGKFVNKYSIDIDRVNGIFKYLSHKNEELSNGVKMQTYYKYEGFCVKAISKF